MKKLNIKEKTNKLIQEKVKKEIQVFKNSKVTRWYDLYKCTECNIETLVRRDVSGEDKICQCQNIHIGNERLYWIWYAMIQRCDNPKSKSYKDYGSRGINISDISWYEFKKFNNWALTNGYDENLTIERKNVNGNYEPDNCIWETRFEQSINRRITRLTKDDILDMRQLDKNGHSRQDIYLKYKEKVNHKTRIDTLIRKDAWKNI